MVARDRARLHGLPGDRDGAPLVDRAKRRPLAQEPATGDRAPRERLHGGSRRKTARSFRQLRDAAASGVVGALWELEYALDTLRADGVILLANYVGKYLGEAAFEPLWAELDRRQAVVVVHPGQPPLPTAAGVAGPPVDYPFARTRTAVQLVLYGIVEP